MSNDEGRLAGVFPRLIKESVGSRWQRAEYALSGPVD